VLSPQRTTTLTEQIDKEEWADSKAPFPYKGSAIGRMITKGDIVYRSWRKKPDISTEGYLMLQNHNVEAIVGAIDAIHQLLAQGLSKTDLKMVLPTHLLEARDAIESVLLEPNVKQARATLLDPAILRQLDDAYVNV